MCCCNFIVFLFHWNGVLVLVFIVNIVKCREHRINLWFALYKLIFILVIGQISDSRGERSRDAVTAPGPGLPWRRWRRLSRRLYVHTLYPSLLADWDPLCVHVVNSYLRFWSVDFVSFFILIHLHCLKDTAKCIYICLTRFVCQY